MNDQKVLVEAAIADAYGRATNAQRELLSTNTSAWRNALVDACESANHQLGKIEEWWAAYRAEGYHERAELAAARAEYKSRRAKAIHFKTKVEGRLRHLKVEHQAERTTVEQDRLAWRQLARWLVDQFDPRDQDGLVADCPAHLREHLAIALRSTGRESSDGRAPRW